MASPTPTPAPRQIYGITPIRPETAHVFDSEPPTRVNSPTPASSTSPPSPRRVSLSAAGSPTSSFTPSLSGATPVPSRPLSMIDSFESLEGPTRVGSPEGSVFEGKEKAVFGGNGAFDKLGEISEFRSDEEKGGFEGVSAVVVDGTDDFPEGGTRAYLALCGSFLVLLCTFGLSNSFGTFLQYYKLHQLEAYTNSDISWIGSLHLFLTFASAFYSGILFDNGWFRYQLAIGSVGWLVGIFTLSFAKTFWQILLAQSVCMGLSLGIMFSPCLSILGTYFRRKRAFVVGVAASGTAIGAVVFPVLLGQLFEKQGFPTAIRAAGFLMLALLIVANLTIRPRQVAAPSADAAATAADKPSLTTVLVRIVRDPAAWIVMLGVFGVYVGCFIVLFYVTSFARQYSSNAALATYSLSIINALAFFSRIGSGLVADRCGVFNTAIPLAFAVAVLTFGMIGATSTAGLTIFLILFGIAQGGWISVSAALFMSLTNDVNELGLRSGIGFLFVALATLIGSPIAGALLIATNGSYVAALCFGGSMATIGVVLLCFGRRYQVRRKSSQRV
ncbi:hypothetical protein JCM3774_004258 [Rhodotorula dairenensis]